MSKPIQVYLDSSDYSALSDPNAQSKEVGKIKSQLISLLENQVIEIRYSMVHIVEMAHSNIEDRELALLRMKILCELCGTKTLRYIPDMEDLELGALSTGDIESNTLPNIEAVANNETGWSPDLSESFKNVRKILGESLKDSLKKTGMFRRQRQVLKKKIFRKGYLTDFAIKQIEMNKNKWNEVLSNAFPITDRFWDGEWFAQYLRGEIGLKEFLREFQGGLLDPINFVGWYIDRYKKGVSLPKWFRNSNEKGLERIKGLRETLDKLYDSGIRAQKTEKEIFQEINKIANRHKKKGEQLRTEYLKGIWTKRRNGLLKLGITKKRWNLYVENSHIGQTPSIDFYILSLINYTINNVCNIKYPRKLLSSDFGDLYHARYLPYMDIFRADKNMGHLFRPLSKRYNTNVVTSLFDLPEAIDKFTQLQQS